MNKAELIEAVAGTMEVSKVQAGKAVETVIGAILDGAVKDGESTIPGLGKLKVVDTAARSGVSSIGGVEKAWSKEASKTIKLRLSTQGKTLVG